METVRRAAHAGSWSTSNANKLEEELDGWLRVTGLAKSPNVRGVIAPLNIYPLVIAAHPSELNQFWNLKVNEVFLLLLRMVPQAICPQHLQLKPRIWIKQRGDR
ncbi:uncharacterized protein [Elaeis guineensis]|uniref:uncharacterized protein n=1 Tax=Elaeis guineensis var. tenera TaxID=51953 RepID=UPI003C6D9F96